MKCGQTRYGVWGHIAAIVVWACNTCATAALGAPVDEAGALASIQKLLPAMTEPLKFEGLRPHWEFGNRFVFSTETTRQVFEVDELTGYVRKWDMGTSKLGEPPAGIEDGDVFEGSLVGAYFDVPLQNMRKVTAHSWYRQLGNDVMAECQQCMFVWDQAHSRVERFYRQYAPIRITATPTLTYAQAQGAARELITRLMGKTELKQEPLGVYATTDMDRMAIVSSDGLGLQRIEYHFIFRVASATPHTSRLENLLVMYVGARSGQCRVGDLGGFSHGLRGLMGQLDIQVAGHQTAFDNVYPALLRAGTPYMYVGYLESLLWPGEVSVSPPEPEIPKAFVVRYQGASYAGAIDETSLQTERGPIGLAHAPVLIGDEVWLPQDALEAITGWSLSADPARQTLLMTPPAKPKTVN